MPSKSKAYIQNNRTNVFPLGNLWSTFNIDLQSNLGALRVSPRIEINTATQGCPVAFQRFGGRDFAVAGTKIYRNTNGLPNDLFSEDDSTNAATDYSSDTSDLLGSWNILFATAQTKLRSLSNATGGTWTDRATITTALNHKMVYFRKFDKVYFLDGGVKSINELFTVSASGDYTLVVNNTMGLVDMEATSNYIWLAVKTMGTKDNMGSVDQWDGISAQVTNSFKIPGARAVVALTVDTTKDTPYALSDKGILYQYNGTGFVEVGRLPYTYKTNPYMGSAPFGDINDRFVHPNGMIFTKNNTIQVLINGVNENYTANQNENLASGIWEWSKETGFVHLNSIGLHYSGSLTDYGQNQISRVGALSDMNIANAVNGSDGTLLIGATVFTNASTTSPNIFYDNNLDTFQKKGYFVSDWFESGEIASSWNGWWATFKKLGDGDNITFKYRVNEEPPVEGTITWVDTTHFTVANTSVDVSKYWTSATGGEVEIVRGTGGGSCVHIINAVLAGGTWTVTVDDVVTGVTTGTAIARFQKWIKMFPRDDLLPLSTWGNWALNTESVPRFQIKGCFTFTGAQEYHKGILISSEDINSN